MNQPEDGSFFAPLLESYSGEGAEFLRFDAYGMGAQNVFLVAGDSETELQDAVYGGMQILDRLEERLSKFLPESDISLINDLGAHSPVHVSAELFELLEKAHQAWRLTDGAFDPTIGPLLEAWGFVDRDWRVPEQDEIARLLELRGMQHVHLDVGTQSVGLSRPGVTIDLGAIGKGYAADRIAEHLRANGARAGAVICGRSTVVTWSTPTGEDSWSFDVVDPLKPQDSLLTLSAEPGAVSSSGAYEKCFRCGDAEYGHVFDPRTGRPVDNRVQGVTVWTRSALLGDVLSTALFVLGPQALQQSGPLAELVRSWDGADSRTGFLFIESATPTDSRPGRPSQSRSESLSWSTHFWGAPSFAVC